MLVAAATVLCWVLLRVMPSVAAPPTSSLARYKPTKPDALAHFEAGNKAYKDARIASRPLSARVRDLKRAIDEYTAGRAVEDVPAFDYNIAHAARLLVDNATAIAHLQRFLEHAEQLDDQLRRAVEEEIAELDPSGAIRAELRQASAQVTESKPPPADPPPAPIPQPSRSAAPRDSQPNATTPPLTTTATAQPRSSGVWVPLGWTLTAAGVIGGGVTTWLALNAAGLDNDATDASRTISERLELQHRADSRRKAALVVGIGSGVAVILGVVTLVLPGRADTRTTSAAWNVGFTGNGVAVSGRF